MKAYQDCKNISSESSTELFLQPVDRCSSKDDPIERVDEYGYRVSCCPTRKRENLFCSLSRFQTEEKAGLQLTVLTYLKSNKGLTRTVFRNLIP